MFQRTATRVSFVKINSLQWLCRAERYNNESCLFMQNLTKAIFGQNARSRKVKITSNAASTLKSSRRVLSLAKL